MDQDKELYKEFLEGNKDALSEIIEKYRAELIFFAQKFVKDYHSAEDVSQEVFIYLMKHKEIYDFKYSFRAYLYTIAKSRALNYIKVKRKHLFIEDDDVTLASDMHDVEEEIFRKEQNVAVRRAIKKLKKDYQIVLYLVEYKGSTYEETAVIMKKSISQVKALVHNAKKRLKVFLEEEGIKGVVHDEINGRLH